MRFAGPPVSYPQSVSIDPQKVVLADTGHEDESYLKLVMIPVSKVISGPFRIERSDVVNVPRNWHFCSRKPFWRVDAGLCG